MKISIKGGLNLLQDGCGYPTRDAIVSLALRDGGFIVAPVRRRMGYYHVL
jgi:hypothetical protein